MDDNTVESAEATLERAGRRVVELETQLNLQKAKYDELCIKYEELSAKHQELYTRYLNTTG